MPPPIRSGRRRACRVPCGLERAGAEVLIGTTPVPGDPDAIYAYDPVLMTDRGVMLLRPGSRAAGASPTRSVPICGRRGERARVAGGTGDGRRGDMLWLDERNLLVGRGYRTNDDGIAQLAALLGPQIDVIVYDLPHYLGPRRACT